MDKKKQQQKHYQEDLILHLEFTVYYYKLIVFFKNVKHIYVNIPHIYSLIYSHDVYFCFATTDNKRNNKDKRSEINQGNPPVWMIFFNSFFRTFTVWNSQMELLYIQRHGGASWETQVSMVRF